MRTTKLLLLFISQALLLLTSCSEKQVLSMSSSNENLLRVSGDQIVNGKGDTIYLRGFGLGGMLHMENFIDGYTANEEAMREGLMKVLGEKKYNIYFNTFFSPSRIASSLAV